MQVRRSQSVLLRSPHRASISHGSTGPVRELARFTLATLRYQATGRYFPQHDTINESRFHLSHHGFFPAGAGHAAEGGAGASLTFRRRRGGEAS